jgi:hypothetical protein
MHSLCTHYAPTVHPLYNITKGPHHGNDEDPFLWQAADGSCHILYHNGAYGYHDFTSGPDCAGTPWVKSPIDAHAFTLDVGFPQGVFRLARRERPQLLFHNNSPAQGPAWLYNGVNTHGTSLPPSAALEATAEAGGHHSSRETKTKGGRSRAFSFVQPLKAE